MKKWWYIFPCCILMSCAQQQAKDQVINGFTASTIPMDDTLKHAEPTMPEIPPTTYRQAGNFIEIEFSHKIHCRWDNHKGVIVRDASTKKWEKEFTSIREALLLHMLDTTMTPAMACGTEDGLAVGDLAFLLIRELHPFPASEALNIQWDSYELNCRYPQGMFQALNNGRTELQHNLAF